MQNEPVQKQDPPKPRYRLAKIVASTTLGIVVLAFVAIGIWGCSSPPDYPVHLSFPSRKDRLVLKVPEAQVPPGVTITQDLDAELAELDVRGGKTADPNTITTETQAALDRLLKDSFGTPAAPTIQLDGDAEVSAAAQRLGLASDSLVEGGKLFRKNCQHCHGLPGDGRGTTGLAINPYPRDFRRGSFKFVTTGEGMKPRRSDLLRTIHDGLKPMPSFSLLKGEERELLARYATYLSIRGQVEFQSMAAQVSGGGDVVAFARGQLKDALAEWEKAEAAPALPAAPDDGEPMTPKHLEAVRRGYDLFIAKTGTECLKCHVNFGRESPIRYAVWGTTVRPANFTEPSIRGGTRPEEVYARVRFGIAPVGMPAHPTLTDRQVWDLVRFVQAASKPRELPEDIRTAVYPK